MAYVAHIKNACKASVGKHEGMPAVGPNVTQEDNIKTDLK